LRSEKILDDGSIRITMKLEQKRERAAAALRLPDAVMAGTAWRQEKFCRLLRFRGLVARVRSRNAMHPRWTMAALQNMMGIMMQMNAFQFYSFWVPEFFPYQQKQQEHPVSGVRNWPVSPARHNSAVFHPSFPSGPIRPRPCLPFPNLFRALSVTSPYGYRAFLKKWFCIEWVEELYYGMLFIKMRRRLS